MKTAPTIAPGKNVAHAASVVGWPPVCPVGPIVSIIEKPHGDQVPVAPIRSPATTRAMMSTGVHQQGTFVWKYMTQKTLRPEKQ